VQDGAELVVSSGEVRVRSSLWLVVGVAGVACPAATIVGGCPAFPQMTAATDDIAMRSYYTWTVFRDVRDSDWSAEHVARHGVTLDEVREAILERPYYQTKGRDDTALIYGRTYAGRYLVVVVVDDQGEAFVVTARDMTPGEKKTFHRKAR
jgi:hypothetical protein